MQRDEIKQEIIRSLTGFSELKADAIDEGTRLVGEKASINSLQLVELLLALEEFSEDKLNARFDWMSDVALSSRRSIFRTVGSLADHLHSLSVKQ